MPAEWTLEWPVDALWARLTTPIWLTGRVANSLRLADSDYANKEIRFPSHLAIKGQHGDIYLWRRLIAALKMAGGGGQRGPRREQCSGAVAQ